MKHDEFLYIFIDCRVCTCNLWWGQPHPMWFTFMLQDNKN